MDSVSESFLGANFIELKIPFAHSQNTDSDYRNQLKRLSASSLAYVGDVVYELYIRTHFILPPKRTADYHAKVVKQVKAEGQIICLEKLKPYLTEAEEEILRWGRNAASGGPRRISLATYQEASSLETLIGYLYLNDTERLYKLLHILNLNTLAQDDETLC